jgi:hypothetical protein
MWERDERESGGVEVHPKEESEVRVDEGAATVGPRQFSELGTGMSTSPREPVSGEEPVAGEDEESESAEALERAAEGIGLPDVATRCSSDGQTPAYRFSTAAQSAHAGTLPVGRQLSGVFPMTVLPASVTVPVELKMPPP